MSLVVGGGSLSLWKAVSQHQTTETRIVLRTSLRKERLLPVRGEVYVRPGQWVQADDVVARCELPGAVWAVDISRQLGVRREQAVLHVCKRAGEEVKGGELVAKRRRRFGGSICCRAPVGGRIGAVRNGTLLIETVPSAVVMRALLSGLVFNVMPERGLVIAATGALIEAAWGTGGQSSGRLNVLAGSPGQAIGPDSVLPTCQGYIVVGGHLSRRETLQRAARVQVRGMILGSLHADLIPLLQVMPYPVLLTEGFGRMSMSPQAFSLLKDHDGQEAMISIASPVPGSTRRPEILIPVESTAEVLSHRRHPLGLQIGSRVRGLRAPYLGQQGTVLALPGSPQTLESGLQQTVAQVELASGQQAWIPLSNLEVIRGE